MLHLPLRHPRFCSFSASYQPMPADSDSPSTSESPPLAAHAEESTHTTAHAPAPSFRGVRKRSWGKWVAEIREPRKRSRIWLGSYFSAEAAARAFDVASYCLRGPSARMNLPDSLPSAVKNLPSLSPKSVQKVALAAGSLADCGGSTVNWSPSACTATAASSEGPATTASTSSAAAPSSSITIDASEEDKRTTSCSREALQWSSPRAPQCSVQGSQSIAQPSPAQASNRPSMTASIRGRRGDAFAKPPRLSIASVRSGGISKAGTGELSSCASNAPLAAALKSSREAGSPVAWQNSTESVQVAGLSWLDRARLEVSPNPTIEQIADAMLLVPPACTSASAGAQQQQQQQGGSSTSAAQLPCCDDFLYDDQHHDPSLWNLF